MTRPHYSVSEVWDLDLVKRLFSEIRGVPGNSDRFGWLYEENPGGRARVWVLESRSGEPVGFTAAYPREFWVEGQVHRALNCGDFSVAVAHRTLGPASILRRPAKRLVDSGEFRFLYAHPVPAMLRVHTRVGHSMLGHMERWVCPLRVDDIVRAQLGAVAGAVIGPLANGFLRMRRRLVRRNRLIEIREASVPSADYDRLDEELGRQYRIIGRRTQAYLLWRFTQQPGLHIKFFEARGSTGSLVGYLVLEQGSDRVAVRDVAYLPGMGVQRALLAHAARHAAASGAASIVTVVYGGLIDTRGLRAAGFWPRGDEQPVVCYGGEDSRDGSVLENPANWFMTIGDRDV